MTTFLFWNINRKPLQDLIVGLVEEHQVDVLMLAESQIPHALLREELNPTGKWEFSPYSNCERVAIYTRFSADLLNTLETKFIDIFCNIVKCTGDCT